MLSECVVDSAAKVTSGIIYIGSGSPSDLPAASRGKRDRIAGGAQSTGGGRLPEPMHSGSDARTEFDTIHLESEGGRDFANAVR